MEYPYRKNDLDKLNDLSKRGDRLLFDFDGVDELRGVCRSAKEWIAKFDQIVENRSNSDLNNESLTNFIAEAESLPIDLSEHTETIKQMTRTYCLCRNQHYGEMVQCDGCEDWFHLPCIGVSRAQVWFRSLAHLLSFSVVWLNACACISVSKMDTRIRSKLCDNIVHSAMLMILFAPD